MKKTHTKSGSVSAYGFGFGYTEERGGFKFYRLQGIYFATHTNYRKEGEKGYGIDFAGYTLKELRKKVSNWRKENA